MFRIGLKFPCNGLNRVRKVKKHDYSRLYLTARCYETHARNKCEPKGRLCTNIKLVSKCNGAKYSTSSPQRIGASLAPFLGAVTVATIGSIGVLYYAKNNPEFRTSLEKWIPGTDNMIRIIFAEESSFFDWIQRAFGSIRIGEPKSLPGGTTETKSAPKSVFEPLVDKKEVPTNGTYTEIRLSNVKGEDVQVVGEKPSAPANDLPKELMPENLVELERRCGDAASKAIAAYQKAACAIQDYNKDVIKIVESAGTTVDGNVWKRLKDATEKRKEASRQAEEHATEALDSLKRMYSLIDEPKFEAASHMKTAARRNVKKILDDVDAAKKIFETELQSGNVTERYWEQVKVARENFNEELEILFPGINIHEKKLSINEESFDLFILHTYNKIVNLEKDLVKLRTVNESKVKGALKASGDDSTQEKLDALICLEVGKEKRLLEDELNKKLLEEQKKYEDEMRRQLKLQSQVHADHLQEALAVKNRETERMVNRALSEQSEADSVKYKSQLASIVGRLRGLEAALKARMEEERGASNAQILWSACQALARAVKSAPPGASIDKAVRPLDPEIKAVCKAAPKEDPLVIATIRGIPEEAAKRGVFPEDTLRERFLKVESVAKRLAMVPEQGAALPIYLLSYLQSFLMIQTANPIPRSELEDEPIDVASLNTYDVLHRARYWLDRGDFKMTLRYMNLLKGASRSIARDWMNEARILLETQQAVETLLAYAGATGLVFLNAGDTKPAEM